MSQKKDTERHHTKIELQEATTINAEEHPPSWLAGCTTYEEIFHREQADYSGGTRKLPGGQLRRLEWGQARAVALKHAGQHDLALRMAKDTFYDNIAELSTLDPDGYERYDLAMKDLTEKIEEWERNQQDA